MHLLLLWLVACGGASNDDALLTAEVGDLAGVPILDAETRKDLLSRGSLVPIDDEVTVEAVEARRAKAVAEAEATVATFLELHPELEDAVRLKIDESADLERTPSGNVVVRPPGVGPVELHGPEVDVRSTARVIELRGDADHQRTVLDLLRTTTVPDCAAIADDLEGLEAEGLWEVRDELGRCADDWWSLFMDRPTFRPRDGSTDDTFFDFDENCEVVSDPPTCICNGAVQDFGMEGNDFPNLSIPESGFVEGWTNFEHVSPVKWQGRRGSCVAFATASALEYATSLATGLKPNLSEQQIYMEGKFRMYKEHYGDGLPTAEFLGNLDNLNLFLGLEDAWGYNPSRCRFGVLGSYGGSCLGYTNPACSDTTHQLGAFVDENGPSWFIPDPGEDGVVVGSAIELFGFAPVADQAIHLSEQGYGLVAGLDITVGFDDFMDESGIFMDDPLELEVGGHAVHVLRLQPAVSWPGNGIVVIKNSWGAGWGDNGYAYLSYKWFFDHLKTLSAVVPTVQINTPPTVTITEPTTFQSSLPLSAVGDTVVQLEAQTDDEQQGPGCCSVRWWSSVEGWFAEGPSTEYRTFRPGQHLIVAIVEDEQGLVDDQWRSIEFTNEGPEVQITRPRTPSRRNGASFRGGSRVPVGVPVVFSGSAIDPDSLINVVPCDQRRWAIDGAMGRDFQGCSSTWTFDEPGWYQVVLTAEDGLGAEGENHRWFRAVAWQPHDPPFVQISWPPYDGYRVDAGFPVTLQSTIVSGAEDTVTATWTMVRNGQTIELGTGPSVQWTPLDGPDTGPEITVTVTDANGTRSDTVRDVFIFTPPN
ncbi:MAG: C1 family peptidase [Myxococcota bacterium]